MKKLFSVAILVILFGCNPPAGSIADDRVEELLQKMTLKEKIGQMNQYSVGSNITGPSGSQDGRYHRFVNGEVGSVLNLTGVEETRKLQELVVEKSRLGIPLIFAYDVIHGYKTIFPLPLAESSSWDVELVERSARIAAIETAASGIQWTFAPMVDITRDARWGRVMEGAGEDPYLGSQMAQARIRGYQGEDLSNALTIAACAKHFAGYGFAESGKDYNTVNIGKNVLHNDVLPPFQAAVKAGVATFMNAFNVIDGVPATANRYLLREILFDKWNFPGVVVSDWNSIGELMSHGVAGDSRQATDLAINAGSHIDMESDAYIENLENLVESGKVDESLIDDAVRRILRLKFQLGLFDDPYRYADPEREKSLVGSDEHRKIAENVAAKSIVLLKNKSNLLPLENVGKLGIIGPLAKDKDAPIGNWRAMGESNSAVSLYEGVVNTFGKEIEIFYAKGCDLSIGPNNFFNELKIEEADTSGFAEARKVARKSDVVLMVLGEPAFMSGEARSRAEIDLPGLQPELLREVYKVNQNIVLILMNGRPLTIPWAAENIPAILEAWHLGSEAGNAIALVLSGKVNPCGKLPMSFPRAVGQMPLYYNRMSTGRPVNEGAVFYSHYMDVKNSALFPFGHGLSYTTFDYDNLMVSRNDVGAQVSVEITNSGKVDGEEVVQLYIRDRVASISRPVLELKGFEKLMIKTGEMKKVVFDLSESDFSFYNANGDLVFEPGEFDISVGTSSTQRLTQRIEI